MPRWAAAQINGHAGFHVTLVPPRVDGLDGDEAERVEALTKMSSFCWQADRSKALRRIMWFNRWKGIPTCALASGRLREYMGYRSTTSRNNGCIT